MITVQRAGSQHIAGISRVCTDGYRDTYRDTHSEEYIERVISEFYNRERIREEVIYSGEGWDGWFVALENETVLGAIGGGMIDKDKGEVFVLYLDPDRRGEGVGTLLLNALSEVQKSKGAKEQWVSVAKGNHKGIPFYEARGFKFVREQTSFGNKPEENYMSCRYCRQF
ncbi:GNAT family N-acetyltransferase [Bacillus sp. T33-2]|uniref:GNAT family N-acetyltransferase n=1 Tax=Bacillus sp. T33-2 TaxID=2054168 RepID=UPI000C75E0AD|nr:GNAT family N-acetyltransferase [Bacillus sp. T33-2]PLR95035.1 GNAT family N-acetyltransferase [Bacillus sp. T33-2]